MPRTVLYDPGFVQRFGHHYTYNSLLRDAFAHADSGADAELLCLFSRHLPDDVANEFPGACRELYSILYEGNRADESAMQRLERRARAHVGDLVACFEKIGTRDTLLFAHTLDTSALYGVAIWLHALPQEQRPTAVLNLMLGSNSERTYREDLAPAIRLLKGLDRVSLFAGTPALADLLSELTGRQCAMLPSPLPESLPIAKASEKIVYGVYGDARAGKNLHILPPAVARYLAAGGRGSFVFACMPTDPALTDSLLALHELSREFPDRVTASFGHLGVEEYYAGIAASTALIVPYSHGRFRPSGPVIEAAAMGVPLIGLAGGFAEDELSRLDNGSLFMPQASPALLGRALLQFDKEYEERAAKARSVAKDYRAGHGTNALLQLFQFH